MILEESSKSISKDGRTSRCEMEATGVENRAKIRDRRFDRKLERGAQSGMQEPHFRSCQPKKRESTLLGNLKGT